MELVEPRVDPSTPFPPLNRSIGRSLMPARRQEFETQALT